MRFEELLALLARDHERRYVLAELNDLLSHLGAGELRDAVAHADIAALSPFAANYVAAMVEQACDLKGVDPPGWTTRVPPLETPYFAAALKNLRPHLLATSPVPFKRRNLRAGSRSPHGAGLEPVPSGSDRQGGSGGL